MLLTALLLLLADVPNPSEIKLDQPLYFEMLPGSRDGHMAKDIVELNQLQKEIFYWTNYARANPDEFAEQCGYEKGQFRPCMPVMWNGDLTIIAQVHCEDMYKDNYFEHDSYDRVNGELVWVMDAFARISSSGYVGGASENIFWAGYTPNGKGAVLGWLTSPPHRANMLNCNWTELGVGAYIGSRATYCCQDFGYRQRQVDATIDPNYFMVERSTNSLNPFEYLVNIAFEVTGLFDVNPVKVTLYDGRPERGGTLIGTYRNEDIFVTTYRHEMQFTWDTQDLTGIHNLVAQLELETPYPDENMDDNVKEWTHNLSETTNETKPNLAIKFNEKDLLATINAVRANPGRYASQLGFDVFEFEPMPPLVVNADLTVMARDQAKDMAAQGRVTSNSLDGKGPEDRVVVVGYQGSFIEEFGVEVSPAQSAMTILRQLFTDYRMQRKLLAGTATEFGTSSATSTSNKDYWVFEIGRQDYRFGIRTKEEWLYPISSGNTVLRELRFAAVFQNWGFNDIQGVKATLYDGPPMLNDVIDEVVVDNKIIRTGLKDTIILNWYDAPTAGNHQLHLVLSLANGFEELDFSDNTIIKTFDMSSPTNINNDEIYVTSWHSSVNRALIIRFNTALKEDGLFNVFDPQGRLIAKLEARAGSSSIMWNGMDAAQNEVATGVYYLVGDNKLKSLKTKLVLLR